MEGSFNSTLTVKRRYLLSYPPSRECWPCLLFVCVCVREREREKKGEGGYPPSRQCRPCLLFVCILFVLSIIAILLRYMHLCVCEREGGGGRDKPRELESKCVNTNILIYRIIFRLGIVM